MGPTGRLKTSLFILMSQTKKSGTKTTRLALTNRSPREENSSPTLTSEHEVEECHTVDPQVKKEWLALPPWPFLQESQAQQKNTHTAA